MKMDYDALRKRSLLPGGFGADRLELWPQLLHATPESAEATEETIPTVPHPDERQIGLDTDRSFVLYPVEEDVTQDRFVLQKSLNTLLVRIFRKHPKLSYFQGYHDIVTVLFLTLPPELQLSCTEQMSLQRLRDAMGKGLEPVISQLRILKNLLQEVDPEYATMLEDAMPMPYFALSNLLTLFSHDMPTLSLVQHLFDYLLCRHPLASVYVAAAFILSRREEAKQLEEEGEEGMLHSLLSGLPDMYDDVVDPINSSTGEIMPPAIALVPPELPELVEIEPESDAVTSQDEPAVLLTPGPAEQTTGPTPATPPLSDETDPVLSVESPESGPQNNKVLRSVIDGKQKSDPDEELEELSSVEPEADQPSSSDQDVRRALLGTTSTPPLPTPPKTGSLSPEPPDVSSDAEVPKTGTSGPTSPPAKPDIAPPEVLVALNTGLLPAAEVRGALISPLVTDVHAMSLFSPLPDISVAASPVSRASTPIARRERRARARVSFPDILRTADELYERFPPSTPALRVARVLGPASVVHTWHEDPARLPSAEEAEALVGGQVALPYFEDESEDELIEKAVRPPSPGHERASADRTLLLAGAVLVLGVAIAVGSKERHELRTLVSGLLWESGRRV